MSDSEDCDSFRQLIQATSNIIVLKHGCMARLGVLTGL